jgi:EGF-like domain
MPNTNSTEAPTTNGTAVSSGSDDQLKEQDPAPANATSTVSPSPAKAESPAAEATVSPDDGADSDEQKNSVNDTKETINADEGDVESLPPAAVNATAVMKPDNNATRAGKLQQEEAQAEAKTAEEEPQETAKPNSKPDATEKEPSAKTPAPTKAAAPASPKKDVCDPVKTCNGRGVCKEGLCVCRNPWTGDHCTEDSCAAYR